MVDTHLTPVGEGTAKSTSWSGSAIVFILCAVIVFSVLLFGAVDTGTLSLLALPSLLIIVIWSWYAFRSGEISVGSFSLIVPLLLLGLLGVVQLLPLHDAGVPADLISVPVTTSMSLDAYATRFFLMRLFLYVIYFAASLTFITNLPRIKTVVIVLIVFGALLAFYSILQRVEQPAAIYGLRAPAQAIPFGTYVNRHHFAALMEMTLGITLGLLFAGGIKKNRWPFLIVAAGVMAIAIVLTGSRGGMLGFIAVLMLIVAAETFVRRGHGHRDSGEKAPNSHRFALIAGGSAFLLLTVGLVLFLGGADPLLRSAGLDSGVGDFSSGRIQFWQTAWKIFRDHPLMGVGLDAFGTAYSVYDPSSGQLRVEQAHNDYIQILSDAGIIGFACVAAFIYLLFRQSIATIRMTREPFRRGAAIGAIAGCFAIMIHSFFDFPLRTPANAFVFLTLATIATVVIPESHSDSDRRRGRSRPSESLAIEP